MNQIINFQQQSLFDQPLIAQQQSIFEYHQQLLKNGRPVIHISFSGGRTSAYMTEWLLSNFSHIYNFIVTYANTGLELEETLQFVRDCDEQKNFKTVWLEAVIHHEKRVATTHKIVDFHSAARDGSIFEEMIKKYGIPNLVYKHCTRELKVRAMNSYLKSLGLHPSKVLTAIGIREDEMTRCSSNADAENLFYPLVQLHHGRVDKEFILDYWRKQPFDLQLEEHNGNCVMCFEKSFSKLIKQVEEYPEAINFHIEMERKYGHINNQPDKPNRVFFRRNISADEVKVMKEEPKRAKKTKDGATAQPAKKLAVVAA